MIEQEKSSFDQLLTDAEEYAKTRQQLAKLSAVEKTVTVSSSVIIGAVLFVFFILFLLFISIAASHYLTSLIGPAYSGALVVAGFYLLVMLILFNGRNTWLRRPIMNGMIKNFFKDDDNE